MRATTGRASAETGPGLLRSPDSRRRAIRLDCWAGACQGLPRPPPPSPAGTRPAPASRGSGALRRWGRDPRRHRRRRRRRRHRPRRRRHRRHRRRPPPAVERLADCKRPRRAPDLGGVGWGSRAGRSEAPRWRCVSDRRPGRAAPAELCRAPACGQPCGCLQGGPCRQDAHGSGDGLSYGAAEVVAPGAAAAAAAAAVVAGGGGSGAAAAGPAASVGTSGEGSGGGTGDGARRRRRRAASTCVPAVHSGAKKGNPCRQSLVK